MPEALFHFYGELDYFLSPEQRNRPVVYRFDQDSDGSVAVKHAVESLGVPHTEVDRIAANGQSVDFAYGLADGDVIGVYACSPKPDHVNLRPPLPRPVRFVLDTHLGRLAVYLRLLGFDALYHNGYSDATLAELSAQEQRVLLTRDRGLLKRRIVDFGCCVRETNPREQLISLICHYQLTGEIQPWRRCLRCNGLLEPVEKRDVLDRLEPKTKRYFEEFRRCAKCGQIYWRGSHYDQMQAFIDKVLAEAASRCQGQQGDSSASPGCQQAV